MAEDRNIFENAGKLWADSKSDLFDMEPVGDPIGWVDSEVSGREREAPSPSAESFFCVPRDKLHKVAKAYQSSIIKFRDAVEASANPTELKGLASEVVGSFGNVLQILLQMRHGASAILREELRDVGVKLAEATLNLGIGISPANIKVSAGMAIDAAKNFERVSVHNRAAARRRINSTLAELRDLDEQLNGALRKPTEEDVQVNEDDDDLDLDECDRQELDPYQRRILEEVAHLVDIMEKLLQEASQACLPSSPSASRSPANLTPPDTVAALEEVAWQATSLSRHVHGLTANSIGDLEPTCLSTSVAELSKGVAKVEFAISKFTNAELAVDLKKSLAKLKATLASRGKS